MLRRACLVATLLAGSQVASATVMTVIPLEQLVARSDRIFVGRVIGESSRWIGRHIVTDATVEVREGVRGARSGERIVVRRLGGRVDGIGMKVAGVAELRRGQDVLLFTELRDGVRVVTGMQQGLLFVARDEQGRARVRRDMAGILLVKRAPTGRVEPLGAEALRAVDVDQRLDLFLSRLRALIPRESR